VSSKQIDIEGIGTVSFYKRSTSRSLRLTLTPKGEVRVSMPLWVPYKTAEQFAREKAEWIQLHRKPPAAALKHGDAIGKAHRLYFFAEPLAEKTTTRIDHNEIRISHPASLAADAPQVQAAAEKAGARALRKEAEKLLPLRLAQLSAETGLAYKSVGVKPLKSRWGSCDTRQNILLNIYLMQLPWHLIDYVLIHELTHTRVMRHGPPFWLEFERHLPHAKRLRKEMAAYQPVLVPRRQTVA
jgi:predicted metal-dependent hydrolase